MTDLKRIKETEYDFSLTNSPELDAINGLIRLADEYTEQGNIEKCHELTAMIADALGKIRDAVIKRFPEYN